MVLVLGCISAVLQAGSGAEFAVLMGTGRVRLLALLNVVPAAAGAGAAIYLIAQTELGVLAPAIALLAGQVLRSVGGFWAVTRITRLHRVQYLRRGFAGPLLCLTCLALASFGVQWLLAGHDLLELASATVFSGIVFAGLTWRVGLNADDRERARGYLRALRLRKGTDPSP